MGTSLIFRALSVIMMIFIIGGGPFEIAKAQSAPEFTIENVLQINSLALRDYQYAQNLLIELGFQNYVEKIDSQLKNGQDQSQVSLLALKTNKNILVSLNAVRDLGAFLFSVIHSASLSSAEISAIEQLLIQQLRPFPMIHFEPMPLDQQRQIKNQDTAAGMKNKRAFANQRAQQRFTVEKNDLRQLFLLLARHVPNHEIYNRQLSQWFEDRISLAIRDAYVYQTRQQNRYLGYALALAYVASARLNQYNELESQLKSKLRDHSLYLENYIQAYAVHDVGNNDLRVYALKSGDVALEYYHGQESFLTSLVIEPSSLENKELASQYRLQTSLLNAYRFIDTHLFYSMLDKIETYKNLTRKDKNIYSDFWNHDYARGFSHSGLVKVNKNEATGLKMAWIWDSYPERSKVGPIRLMTVQGFAYPERMMRLGFLRYSPYKILESLKTQIKNRGYLKSVWESNESFVGESKDGTMVPNQDEDSRYLWPSTVAEATVREWMNINSSDADSWFENAFLPRVFQRLDDYLSGPNATLFADGFSNGKNLLYCSQMVVMAFLQGGNLDLQETPDQIWSLITYFSDEVKSALKLSIGQRLVSPNGLIWQKNIFQNLYQVNLTKSTTTRQMQQLNPTWAQQYSAELEVFIENLKKSQPNPWHDVKPPDEQKLNDDDDVVFDVET